jgi:hypothetical protein
LLYKLHQLMLDAADDPTHHLLIVGGILGLCALGSILLAVLGARCKNEDHFLDGLTAVMVVIIIAAVGGLGVAIVSLAAGTTLLFRPRQP